MEMSGQFYSPATLQLEAQKEPALSSDSQAECQDALEKWKISSFCKHSNQT